MIKLVIFDLDGTLVNSVEDLADATNTALAENGYEIYPTDRYYHFVGNGTKKLIERALPKGTSAEECERIHEIFSHNYREHCLDKTLPYDGIKQAIEGLKKSGIKCAVASNKPDEFSKHIVYSLFSNDYFDLVRGKSDGVAAKPSPDIIFDIMKRLDVKADETVMVGDSDVDVMTAKNAGIRCIGCEWGFRGREELLSARADFIIALPEQIMSAVDKINKL